ncbi:hypothetical protein MCHIJ_19380 [Mycolicibacterium chitae]|uniref:CdiI immunity protein domain-containing protein n=1 Tax=Mycolicibacterium chitae TaxID=1792 RepID=A0A448HYC7_MYCCI|nr:MULTISPECIES: contact-dependent growth inhibition system immunity protein [Mycolicibacterium]MCV7106596.1 hypothetical protein [Mycolicibacterium chitae]MCV7175207.1 hypothetical protein [Mycolicibacterium sphagni]BBZ02501.1 hypothetical protein MCHIJ_19380 [Mycolicibacterium chitae]VEG45124.1 Uncharacterised protein [Mycolicibacterium chitae]
MSEDSVSYAIQQFFGGNFHQDWDLEAENWQSVIDNYAVGKGPSRLHALAQDIDDLRQMHGEDELKVLMPRRAHAAYNPRPITYKEWLGLVADRLRGHAAAIEGGAAH